MDTIVLAPAGYLLDPDIGSDYERPWRLAQGLAQRGFRVVVIAREVKQIEQLGPNVEINSPSGDLPNSPVGKLLDRARLYWHARRVAHREVVRGEAMVVHHLGPCGEYSPSLVGRLPVPIVYGPLPAVRPANLEDDEWSSWLRTPTASPFQVQLSRFVVNGAGLVAHKKWKQTIRQVDAVTVEAKANVPARRPDAIVIPPGLNIVQFRPVAGEPQERGRVIGVGRLLQRKGYDMLIRAMARVARRDSRAHLILVGGGPEEAKLRVLANQLGIDSRVTFVGETPRSNLPRLLRSAEIFCHPAIWDNVPFAPLEAMACGLPTVVSSAGGLPDTVGQAGVIYKAGDQIELSQRLLDLLANQKLRRELGMAARERVLAKFTWDVMCDSYVSLYRQLKSPRRRHVEVSSFHA